MAVQTFWNKNKVFILGLLSAISIVLSDFLKGTEINWPTIGLAVGMAILSYLAKEWRGQGMSILGIIGMAADTVYNLQLTGQLSWERAALALLVAIGMTSLPDPKSRGYEQTATIKQAKAEGEAITPANLTAKPKV